MALQGTDIFMFQRGGANYKAPATQVLSLAAGSSGGCTQPPFYCTTNIETYCVFDFTQGWKDCTSLTVFPQINTQGGVYFVEAWKNCTGLTSFPSLMFDSAISFRGAWEDCTNLTTFPSASFDNCQAIDFSLAFSNCALSQTSVDNILISVNAAGTSGGTIDLNGGTSSAPGAASLAARTAMLGRGWTINVNP